MQSGLAGGVGAHGTFHLNLLQTLKNMERANPMRLQAYLKTLGQVGGTLRILMGRYGQVTAAVKTFEHAQGATYSLASEMNKGWHQQLEDLHNVWGNLERSLGQVLVPLLIEVAHVLEPMLEGFRRFAKAHATIVKVAFAAAVLLTGLLVLGGVIAISAAAFGTLSATAALLSAGFVDLTSASWAFTASLLADPIFDVLAAVVALSVGAYELVHHWKAVEGFFVRIAPTLERPFIKAWHAAEAFGERVESWGLGILNWFGHHKIFAALMGPIGWMMMAADELVTHWKSVESFFKHLADVLGGVFKDIEQFLHIGHAASPVKASVKHHQAIEHVLRAAHVGSAVGASVTHHRIIEHVASAVRAVPERALAFGRPAPILAAGGGGGVSGGVHFHAHIEGGAAGTEDEHELLADRMLEAFSRNQDRFTQQFADINDRTRGQWQSAGF